MSPVFVLSAGRTGTVFLTRTLPEHVPGLHCVHEPEGSRTNLMRGNLMALTGWGREALSERIAAGIAERFAATPTGQRYVEVNPMLCPMADLLPELVEPLEVVHLVRHPVSWVRSIRAFRASGVRRHLIDFVPLANPAPVPRPDGWLGFDPVHQALWRWRACNEAIEAIAGRCMSYTRLRYEDLFLADEGMRETSVRRLIAALGVEAPRDLTPLLTAPRANRAPEAQPVQVPEAQVRRVCGALLDRYGYDAAP